MQDIANFLSKHALPVTTNNKLWSQVVSSTKKSLAMHFAMQMHFIGRGGNIIMQNKLL